MSEKGDQYESDGEKSERGPQPDAGQPVIAEIARSASELGADTKLAPAASSGVARPLALSSGCSNST